MSKLILSLVLIVAAISAQAGNPEAGTPYKINTDQSSITWTGHKLTGEHSGTVAVKDGTLLWNDGILEGGTLTLDMTTIVSTDLEGEGKTNLEGHLKSEDFFGVVKYPTSSLVIRKAISKGNGQYTITADLTIKESTNPVTFDAFVKTESNKVTATAAIKIDRTQYNIRYGSGKFFDNLGDKVIYDEFDLNIKLVATSK